jgi:hypothetical protein
MAQESEGKVEQISDVRTPVMDVKSKRVKIKKDIDSTFVIENQVLTSVSLSFFFLNLS